MSQFGGCAYSDPKLEKYLNSLSLIYLRCTSFGEQQFQPSYWEETFSARQFKPIFTMSANTTEIVISLAKAHRIQEMKPGFGVVVEGLDFEEGVTKKTSRWIEELVKKVSVLPLVYDLVR